MKRILSYFSSISYTTKIMISFISIIVIPLLFFGSYIYVTSVQAIQKQSMQLLVDELHQKSVDIEQKFADYETRGLQITTTPMITNFFGDSDRSHVAQIDLTLNLFNPYIEWIRDVDPDIHGIHFFTNNPLIIESDKAYSSETMKNQPWFITAIKSTSTFKPYWEPIHKKRNYPYTIKTNNSDEFTLSLFCKLLSNEMMSDTILELDIPVDNIFRTLDNSTIYMKGLLMVTDENNNPVFYVNKSSNDLPSDFTKLLKANKLYEIKNNTISINGSSYFISTLPLNRLNYRLIGLCPVPSVMQKAQNVRSVLIIYLLIGFILLFIIAYILSRGLTSKIKILVKGMRRVQNGQLDFNISIKGNDEFAELGYDFNLMINTIKQLINEVYKSKILEKEANLKALRDQINPHFLYNSLETIKMMAKINHQKEISFALTSLGTLLRYNLFKSEELVTIANELDHLNHYINLQNLMLNGRLKCISNVGNDILNLKIMRLIIQPIVENAIMHGFEDKDDECIIHIDIQHYEKNIKIVIEDNGKGMSSLRIKEVSEWINSDTDEPKIDLTGNGVGLKNVNQRIKLNFGDIYGITIECNENKGTIVNIELPVII